MWEQYQPPSEDRENREPSLTRPNDAADRPSAYSQPIPAYSQPIRAGGQHSGAGVGIGIAAAAVAILVSVGVASSVESAPAEDDYSDWYACIAEEEADDPGLLSPADLCEIGHDRPPGYVDDYEYDPGLGGSFKNDSYFDDY